jgi:SpoVK/Ycf46/Vps4 family AAA+-type ATPase
VIRGPPGVGKTTFVKVYAEILVALGSSQTSKIVHARADNCIGEFVGHTEANTRRMIESAFGGVLLLDEISSFNDGRAGNGTAYSKAFIDTINRALTEDSGKFICVVAGYDNEIKRDFFAENPGLERRFSVSFTFSKYTKHELCEIAQSMLRAMNLTVITNLDCEMFADSKLFTHHAGDVEILCGMISDASANRTFGQMQKETITTEDIVIGFSMFKIHKTTIENQCFRSEMSMYM